MRYQDAVSLLQKQDRELRKIRDIRISDDKYEYRINYTAGFAAFIKIERREIGKRNFQYFGGVSAASCRTAREAMELVYAEIREEGEKQQHANH